MTEGSTISVAAGQLAMGSEHAGALLGHELTHVAQQQASNQRTVQHQPLQQPIVAPAPVSAVSIHKFIELVQLEEAKFSPGEQLDTVTMITRLRKIFYDRKGWDEHLIKTAKDVKPIYQTTEKVEPDYRIEIPGPFNDIYVNKSTHTVTDPTTGKTPTIATTQEVRLDDGSYIDIGHVFAGLDALSHRHKVEGPGTIDISDNVAAVTWVGDLGSVLAEVQYKAVRAGSISRSEIQRLINEYASPQDMLGNIDAYAIGATYGIGTKSVSRKVSDLLREYYLGEAPIPEVSPRERRYSTFAAAVGLRGWNGTSFANESAWIKRNTDEVNDAAALYIGAGTSLNLGSIGAALGMSLNQSAKTLVKLFLDALKQLIAREP